ncbi:MAG: Npt1/Npt2 family nucleotide transporter [Alphaproteobacteria bacterium]|nr:Npt1/Npt2 family nucleotide transporter [Alphaproteobacteria bacterium]
MQFAKIFHWFFPVEKNEWKIVIKFGLLMSCVSANFWLVHNLKDTLIMTAPKSSAECINYLKIFVFFFTLGFVSFYSYMTRKVMQRGLIQRMLYIFIFIFFLFATVLLPYSEILQMSPERIAALQEMHPPFKWMFPVIGYWIFSLFYVTAEMWSMTCYSILFWQFVNTGIVLEQGKRYYTIFGIFNGFTTVIMGYYMASISNNVRAEETDSFKHYLDVMSFGCFLTVLFCIIMLFLYHSIYKHNGALRLKREYALFEKDAQTKPQRLWDSIKTVIQSWYMGLIFLLGLCYNLAHTLVDVTWKQQVKQLCQTPFAIQELFGNFTQRMGWCILICSLFSGNLVRKLGWRFSAFVTPFFMFVSGTLFFTSISLRGWEFGYFATLMFSVTYGQWHELIVRTLKHSIFNVTRELVYVPLDFHQQVQAKAVADVLGGRVGKLLGATIQAVLLLFVAGGTQSDIVPYAITLFWGILVVWVAVVVLLNKRFLNLASYKKM